MILSHRDEHWRATNHCNNWFFSLSKKQFCPVKNTCLLFQASYEKPMPIIMMFTHLFQNLILRVWFYLSLVLSPPMVAECPSQRAAFCLQPEAAQGSGGRSGHWGSGVGPILLRLNAGLASHSPGWRWASVSTLHSRAGNMASQSDATRISWDGAP